MKYTFFFIVLLTSIWAQGQTPTTLEEYNYLTKGYAYQKSMGLDPSKKGYDIVNEHTTKDDVSIVAMYKTGAVMPQGILFITPQENGKKIYFAIPTPDAPDAVKAAFRKVIQTPVTTVTKKKFESAKNEYLFVQNSRINDQLASNTPFSKEDPAGILQTTNVPKGYDDTNTSRIKVKTTSNKVQKIYGQLSGDILSRNVIQQAEIQEHFANKGKVIIKFCATPAGRVDYARFTQRGSTTLNSKLKMAAIEATKKIKFAPISSKAETCGTAAYLFN